MHSGDRDLPERSPRRQEAASAGACGQGPGIAAGSLAVSARNLRATDGSCAPFMVRVTPSCAVTVVPGWRSP